MMPRVVPAFSDRWYPALVVEQPHVGMAQAGRCAVDDYLVWAGRWATRLTAAAARLA
jgi:hypothetical protein